jgi:hypothetical protein
VATVTNQLTRFNTLDGSLTSVSIGGGAGATANTDIFIQGTQSLGRRQSGVTLNGFLLDNGAPGIDLSASGIHMGAWVWVTHYAVLTALRVRIAGNNGTANFAEHALPLTEYPTLGGWVRVWVDLDRTAEATGGTGLQRTAVRYLGPIISLPSVGGNAQNLILDAIDYGTSGLLLTGTAGLWQDFVTADEATANKYGVVNALSGIVFVRARLTLGSASSLVFDDSNFVIVFPQQNLVSTTWMGITCDLQNASTSITVSAGSFQSPGTRKGDFVVTGTSGSFLTDSCTFFALRIVTFTIVCQVLTCTFQACGTITSGGCTFLGNAVNDSPAAVAFVWNSATDTSGRLDGTTFTSAGTGHALEFTTVGTYLLSNVSFVGYGGNNTTNAAVFVSATTGTLTLNISGSAAPTVRTAGATVNVVVAFVLTLTGIPSGVRVTIVDSTTRAELLDLLADGNDVTYAHSGGQTVDILFISLEFDPNLSDIYDFTLPFSDTTLPFSFIDDNNYVNPD